MGPVMHLEDLDKIKKVKTEKELDEQEEEQINAEEDTLPILFPLFNKLRDLVKQVWNVDLKISKDYKITYEVSDVLHKELSQVITNFY